MVVALTVLVLSVTLVVVGNSVWWCNRKAPERLDRLEAAGSMVLGSTSPTVSRENLCDEPGRGAGVAVYFAVTDQSRRQVEILFAQRGWSKADGQLVTSPDGKMEIQYPTVRDRSESYVNVGVFFKQ